MQAATARAAGLGALQRAAIAGAALALCGCVSSRVLREPAVAEPSRLGWTVAAPDGPSLTLRQLIVTNNAGTWVKDALWDEYAIEVHNPGATPLELQSLRLYSAHLPPQAPAASRELLEAATARNMGILEGAGILVGVGVVAPLALVATAGGGSSMAAGTLAAAAAANLMVVGLIAGGSYVISKAAVEKNDREYIDAELDRRAIALPGPLPAGATVTGSAFFAVTPQPTRLVLELRDARGPLTLELDLTPLEALDLVPKEDLVRPARRAKAPARPGDKPHNPWACARCGTGED